MIWEHFFPMHMSINHQAKATRIFEIDTIVLKLHEVPEVPAGITEQCSSGIALGQVWNTFLITVVFHLKVF